MPQSRPVRRATAVALCSWLLTVPVATGMVVAAGPAQAAAPTKRYIVHFATSADPGRGAQDVAKAGGSVRGVLRRVFPGAVADLTAVQASALRQQSGVARVEVDQVMRASEVQSPASWGLDRIDQASGLSGSFSYGVTGAGVTAYVLDTGVRSDHTEFGGRVAAGYTAIADGGGTEDCYGHGTHVAGTIAGATYGVAKATTIVPVRVLGCDGSGLTSGIITALDWVVGHHAAGVPAVANLSLGGAASPALDAAVASAVADGITVVVSAGNSTLDACTTSPAREASAITVGATTGTDARAPFSNHGTCLDLFAPGVAVPSAWHTGPADTGLLSGTSMAAPHVAGAAAALLQSAPTLTPAQVAGRLTAAATVDLVTDAGAGSPNRLLFADPALVPATTPTPSPVPSPSPTPTPTKKPAVARAPATPTKPVAVPSGKQVRLTWSPADNGGAPVTSQKMLIYYFDARGKVTVREPIPLAGSLTTLTLTDLPPGLRYQFRLSATNSAGTSRNSALSNSFTIK